MAEPQTTCASEGMLGYINHVHKPGENLKAIGGEVTEMDVALSVLVGLMSNKEKLLVALHAREDDIRSLEFAKSRLFQEERRRADKSPAVKHTRDMAVFGARARGESRRGGLPKVECFYSH